MGGDDYLHGLPPEQAAELTRVNEPGLTALRDRRPAGKSSGRTLRALASQSPEEVVEIIRTAMPDPRRARLACSLS